MALSFALFSSTPAMAQRAILIGVSLFDHLPIRALEGPPNDVTLMNDMLVALGVPQQNIVKLVDSATPDLLPRRANILRVLGEEARRAKRGETVVVYFSSHSAQVPQLIPVAKGGWVEPDGLNEVFLTRDTTLWNAQQQRVEGAILNDEIGLALSAFTKRGVRLWAIFDTCHAGDMARGSTTSSPDAVVWRGVNAAVLGVAPTAVPLRGERGIRMAHQRNMSASTSLSQATHEKSHHPLLTAFYASQPDESSSEEWFHYQRDPTTHAALAQPRRFGLFTWQLKVDPRFKTAV